MSGLPRLRIAATVLAVLAPCSAARARLDPPEIGSWTLLCPASPRSSGCILRLRDGIAEPIGSTGLSVAVEVHALGHALIPVIALRGLTMREQVAGTLLLAPSAALRFDTEPPLQLNCGPDGAAYLCAPQGAAATASSIALRKAAAVTVRITFAPRGMAPLPPIERSVALKETEAALARLRASGAAGEAAPVEAGLDWRGALDKVLRATGLAGGAADPAPRLAPGGSRE
ncbi:MAG TPA: hypothetical protein VN702_18230 [Acetobacteraceae bacterium]|nr:hypothetical protein [Acetobacteraceae bacterium]